MSELVVRRTDPRSQEARALLAELDADLVERYPALASVDLDVDEEELRPGRGAFLVAYLAEEPVGCGALRTRAEGGEVKRMWVSHGARRRGVARALLSALEEEARALGLPRVVVETGDRQPEAVALYRASGYEPIEAFGEYRDNAWSRCFARGLG